MLEQVCRQTAAWKRQGLETVPVSVNISASWFTHRALIDRIDQLLRHSPAAAIEPRARSDQSLLVRDVEKCIERMHELRDRGIAISLDDFGTGYSSLSYLKVMPLDEVEAGPLIRDRNCEARAGSCAGHVIITLAQQLNLSVVAEGVETEDQASVLAAMGCHIHQGYLCWQAYAGHRLRGTDAGRERR